MRNTARLGAAYAEAGRSPASRSRPLSQPRTAAERALGFTTGMLAITLLLQRFGIPLGSKAFSAVGPIGLAFIAYALSRGTLKIHRFRLCVFLALSASVMLGLLGRSISPRSAFDGGIDLRSMAQFLLLTSFAVFAFAAPVGERTFFRRVNAWFAFIAVAGILQFVAQFAGIRVFRFTGLLPWQLLFEYGYNVQIPVGLGGLFKSNGFFLIEPSTFSQVMALGIIIEVLSFRRPWYFVLFIVGLLLSFSGTGWLVLGSFLLAAMFSLGWRGVAMAGFLVVVLGAAVGSGLLLAPNFADTFAQRIDEFSTPGTSAHRRFVTPFWALHDTLETQPSAALIGLGSGVSERLPLAYDYDVNTPVKIVLDDGIPALIAYVLLFLGGRSSGIQRSLTVPACTLFFLTGAYQQFAPIVFLVLLITSVAWLEPEESTSS